MSGGPRTTVTALSPSPPQRTSKPSSTAARSTSRIRRSPRRDREADGAVDATECPDYDAGKDKWGERSRPMAQTATRLRDLANRCEAENFRPVAHHDLNGVGDAMQIVKKGDFVYVAHVGYNDLALSILDVSDVENPKMVRQIPKSKNAHSHKV